MGPLGFFIDLSFRPHYDTGVNLTSKRNEYQEYLLDSKGGRCLWLTLPPSCADFLGTVGASTTWSPTGLCRPVMGHLYDDYNLSSSFARQPLVAPGLLKKLCPFVSVEGDLLPVLSLWYSHILINTIFPTHFRSSNSSYAVQFSVKYFFYSSIVVHTHQLPCPCQSFNFDVIDNVWIIKYFV